MKKTEGILLGMLIAVISIVACSSPSQRRAERGRVEQGMSVDKSALDNAKANTMVVKYLSTTSPVSIQQLAYTHDIEVHEVKYKGKTLLIISDYNTGLAIYDMTEPIVVEPSDASLGSLTNPEGRPVPVGSEQEFIDYHTDVTDISLVDGVGLL